MDADRFIRIYLLEQKLCKFHLSGGMVYLDGGDPQPETGIVFSVDALRLSDIFRQFMVGIELYSDSAGGTCDHLSGVEGEISAAPFFRRTFCRSSNIAGAFTAFDMAAGIAGESKYFPFFSFAEVDTF